MRFAPGDSPNNKRPRLSPGTSLRSSSVSSTDSDEYHKAREEKNTPRGRLVEQINQMFAVLQFQSDGSQSETYPELAGSRYFPLKLSDPVTPPSQEPAESSDQEGGGAEQRAIDSPEPKRQPDPAKLKEY